MPTTFSLRNGRLNLQPTSIPRSLPTLVVAFLLLCAIYVQLTGPYAKRSKLEPYAFDAPSSEQLQGWSMKTIPIADSPEMLKTVETVLNFDSASFRSYEKNGVEISIYAAYWLPGKVDKFAVHAHTPDICWVHNGWKMELRPPLAAIQGPIDGKPLSIPNVRVFQNNGVRLNVAYWQIYGDRIEQISSVSEEYLNFQERVRRRLTSTWFTITTPPREQLFLRISSSQPLPDILETPPVAHYLSLVGKMLAGANLGTQ